MSGEARWLHKHALSSAIGELRALTAKTTNQAFSGSGSILFENARPWFAYNNGLL
jgi:hypothetical protein